MWWRLSKQYRVLRSYWFRPVARNSYLEWHQILKEEYSWFGWWCVWGGGSSLHAGQATMALPSPLSRPGWRPVYSMQVLVRDRKLLWNIAKDKIQRVGRSYDLTPTCFMVQKVTTCFKCNDFEMQACRKPTMN